MSALVVVVMCGAAAFALRASVVVALGDHVLPECVRRASTYMMPAMMSALVAGSLSPAGGRPDARLVLAALAGTTAAVRSRSVAWTFFAGMAVYALGAVAPV